MKHHRRKQHRSRHGLTRSDGTVYGLADCFADISVVNDRPVGNVADAETTAATALSRVLICLAVLMFLLLVVALAPSKDETRYFPYHNPINPHALPK